MAELARAKIKGPSKGPWFIGNGMRVQSGGIIGVIVGVITGGGVILLAVLVEQLHAVVRPDQFAQVIKQFDDGEGLLRRPVGRDFEGDGERRPVETLFMTWLCVVDVRAARIVRGPP